MMKKLLPFIAAAFMFAACGNAGEESTETNNGQPMEMEHGNDHMSTAKGKIDPVCEMEYDPEWTEYSVQGADTVWFCSETCKEAFDKNPSKYADKIKS